MIGVLDPYSRTGLTDIKVRVPEKLQGFFYAQFIQILHGGIPIYFGEFPTEAVPADVEKGFKFS